MKLPNLPADRKIAEQGGELSRAFWTFFDSIIKALRQAVYGGPNLTTVGAIPKVSEAGTLAESRMLESEVLYAVQSTQANLAALAATLGAGDAGKLVEVTDYLHILRWTGSGWQWGPGETGGGYVGMFAIDPGSGWHQLDGSAVNYLKADGTTGSVALPNLIGNGAFAKGAGSYASYTGTLVPAVDPSLSGSTAAAATGITATTAATGATASALAGAGAAFNYPVVAHTHAVSVTDPQHSHGPGTLAASLAGGDPVNKIVFGMYFRI